MHAGTCVGTRRLRTLLGHSTFLFPTPNGHHEPPSTFLALFPLQPCQAYPRPLCQPNMFSLLCLPHPAQASDFSSELITHPLPSFLCSGTSIENKLLCTVHYYSFVLYRCYPCRVVRYETDDLVVLKRNMAAMDDVCVSCRSITCYTAFVYLTKLSADKLRIFQSKLYLHRINFARA